MLGDRNSSWVRISAGLRGGILLAIIAIVLPVASPASSSVEPTIAELAQDIVRCRDIHGEHWCFPIGFTDVKPGTDAWTTRFPDEPVGPRQHPPGDLTVGETLEQLADLSPQDLASRRKRAFESATKAVGRVKLYDFLAESEPIPDGFFAEYPETGIEEGSKTAEVVREAARTGDSIDIWELRPPTEAETQEEALSLSTTSSSSTIGVGDLLENCDLCGAGPDAPEYRYIIYEAYRQQVKSNWCGPGTIQSIDGADDGYYNKQSFWADVLGTTSAGTSISSMVRVINDYTSWDLYKYGGPYSVVDTHGKSLSWFWRVHEMRIGVYEAPIVEHVKLWKKYYSYLENNHNGHFQIGRGYSNNSNKIAIFEPYDEDRFCNPCGSYTGKRQYVHRINIWNANQAYSSWMQNIGA